MKIEIKRSGQNDDHYAIYVEGEMVVTTTIGWDRGWLGYTSDLKLAVWKGFPEEAIPAAAVRALVNAGVGEILAVALVEVYASSFGDRLDTLNGICKKLNSMVADDVYDDFDFDFRGALVSATYVGDEIILNWN